MVRPIICLPDLLCAVLAFCDEVPYLKSVLSRGVEVFSVAPPGGGGLRHRISRPFHYLCFHIVLPAFFPAGDFCFKFSIAYHEHIPDIFLSIRIKILSDEVCLCLTFGCGEFHVYIPIPERGRQSAEIVVAHDISVHKMLVIQRSSVFSPAEAQFARFPKDRYFSLTAFDFFSKYIL